jgi:thioesterase domain-containing protein
MQRLAENPIVLREGGAGALVVTHPGALRVETYEVLAAALPEDIGMYVFAIDRLPEYHRSVLSGDPLEITLSDIAERFAKDLTVHIGQSRYAVLGWSFGGVVAYAVAETASQERPPEHVLLLDSIAPGSGDPGRELGSVLPDREALDWFALYLGAKRNRPLGFTPADFADVDLEGGLRIILDEAISRGALFGDTSVYGLRKAFETYVSGVLRNKQLHDGYTPEKPRWPVSLLRPRRGLFDDVAELGWDGLLGDRLAVHGCAGDHYTMLTDPDSVGLISGLVDSALTR